MKTASGHRRGSPSAVSLAACGRRPDEAVGVRNDHGRLGEFPENEIIAEIYAQALEAKGVKVKKKLNIGAREAYIPALKNGEIDLMPEYTGNLLTLPGPEGDRDVAEADVEAALDNALPDGLRSSTRPGRGQGLAQRHAGVRQDRTASRRSPTSRRSRACRLGGQPRVQGTARTASRASRRSTASRGSSSPPISDGGGPARSRRCSTARSTWPTSTRRRRRSWPTSS